MVRAEKLSKGWFYRCGFDPRVDRLYGWSVRRGEGINAPSEARKKEPIVIFGPASYDRGKLTRSQIETPRHFGRRWNNLYRPYRREEFRYFVTRHALDEPAAHGLTISQIVEYRGILLE